MTKQICPSIAGSHSYPPTLQQLGKRQKAKERGKWRETGGGDKTRWRWWWWWEFPLTGAPLQHLHIFRSANEYHAWGQTKTSQWEGCIPAAGSEAAAGIPAAPWERHREVVWEPRGPPSWAEGGEPLVARGELAFYLCPFTSVISAPPLQPQMANMAGGLAFVSKMMIMEVFFHPDRDISSHSVRWQRRWTQGTEYWTCFCIFLLLMIKKKYMSVDVMAMNETALLMLHYAHVKRS